MKNIKQNKQAPKVSKMQKRKKNAITLLELIIIVAILAIIGRFIYHLVNWKEAVDAFKNIGLWGSLAVITVCIIIRKIIDSL